ncbi:MAG: hypothetical protein HZC47_02005 [Methanobacterium sp.]|uniref:hypothetical protein n=1 Tax=Methanobacterium sp. TaxID=2164 RepID=UPI003D6546AA|nr:hypothetical protein [Methanobacterium sp.]
MKKKLGRPLILLTFVIILTCLLIGAVSAADIYVNDTTGVDAPGGGTIDNPYKTISYGITQASGTSTDTVILAPETFSAPGDYGISINKNVNIKGAGKDLTKIDAGGHDRVFNINPNCIVTLSNLTITNGHTALEGGAIFNGGILTANDCAFTGNTASNSGAIFNGGTLTANDCVFTGNTAIAFGGAIFNGGTVNANGCVFTGNTANFFGGAIDNMGTVNANGCVFTGNTADYGGAIINEHGTLTANGCVFTGNTAEWYGGAIDNMGTLTANGCVFTGNTAEWDGGAIFNGGILTANDCVFTGNTADYGGAIMNQHGIVTVNFSRIVGNTATNISAIYNFDGLMNAEYNWWGSNVDPKTVTNLISEDVDDNPWLKLSIVANPTEVINTMTSQVTADLYTDSNGISHSSEFAKYPSEIPVTFATTWGCITQVLMKYGTATATFTANGGPISGPIITTVSAADSANPLATVTTHITIKSAPIVNAATSNTLTRHKTTGNAANTKQTTTPAPTTNNTTSNSNETSAGTQGNGLLSYWWIIAIILLLIASGLLWFLLA